MHVVTSHIDSDQALEDNRPTRPGGAQENQQTSRGTAIRNHIQDRAEGSRLIEIPRRVPIQGIKEARNTVKNRASSRVKRHIIQGSDS